MRLVLISLVLCFFSLVAGCARSSDDRSPVDTLKLYVTAIRDKDTTQMKLLLSAETLKLHTEQANAQNVTLDEIVQREMFFPPDQRLFAYRNEKIEGNKANVEVKNSFGGWDLIFLVNENGGWKIDKKGTAQNMIDQSEKDVQSLDDRIDAERKQIEEQLNREDSAKEPLKDVSPLGSPSPDNGISLDPENGRSPSPLPGATQER